MAKCWLFDFRSLDLIGLEFTNFIATRLFRFFSYQCDFYPDLIQEFYANLFVDELDEAFDDFLLKSEVNGVEVNVDGKLLGRLFELSDEGRKCTGAEFMRNEQGETIEICHDFITRRLLEKCKA